MTDRIAEARKVALNAFNAMWEPGPKQRTKSRDVAMYWLSIALRKPCVIVEFDTLSLSECVEIAAICRRAHGPTTVSLHS